MRLNTQVELTHVALSHVAATHAGRGLPMRACGPPMRPSLCDGTPGYLHIQGTNSAAELDANRVARAMARIEHRLANAHSRV